MGEPTFARTRTQEYDDEIAILRYALSTQQRRIHQYEGLITDLIIHRVLTGSNLPQGSVIEHGDRVYVRRGLNWWTPTGGLPGWRGAHRDRVLGARVLFAARMLDA